MFFEKESLRKGGGYFVPMHTDEIFPTHLGDSNAKENSIDGRYSG